MIRNQANLRTLGTSFSALFTAGLGIAAPQYDEVATIVPSNTGQNEYGWLGEIEGMREWVGDRHLSDISTSSYVIKNKKFERTIEVKGDDIDDDNVGIYSMRFRNLGRAAGAHPNELVFGALKAGFNTNCYDGQFFFDTDHPVIGADGNPTTVANTDGGAGAPWFLFDSTQVTKPIIFQKRKDYSFKAMDNVEDEQVFMRDSYRYGVDARVNVGYGFWQVCWGSKQALSAANYEAAHAALVGMKGDYGRPLGIMPDTLVVGASNASAARKILNAELINGGDSNTNKGTAKLIVSPWL
ncbi:MAG: Mu-like prophage major head subunit gpT family protein [Sphingorhabdus sp.]